MLQIRKRVDIINTGVYIFAGFLESGKTTALQGVLLRNADVINKENKSLIICTEDGEEEYDSNQLKELNTSVVMMEDEDGFDLDYLEKIQEEYTPSTVYIEFNGMWDLKKFLQNPMPVGWIVMNVFTLVDATTFDIYLTNMRQVIMNPISVSDVILFNRCTENTKKGEIRRPIKILNPNGQLYFSRMDGSIDDGMEDFLVPQEDGIVHVEEDIFCSWFVDCIENPDKYYGKRVAFKAMVTSGKGLSDNQFYVGRLAAICCQADAQFIGFIAEADENKPKDKEWIEMEATVERGELSEGKQIILLNANSIKQVDKPEDIYIYA